PTDPESGSDEVPQVIRELLETSPSPVSAIGVAIAAWVEHPSGRIAFAPNLSFTNADLERTIGAGFDIPVLVENDANCAAWAEHRFGAGKGTMDMLMVAVGTGIGGGIIAGGRLYRGSRGFAGEFGHVPISLDGPRCACGNIGCLEAWASGSALGRLARERAAGHEESEVMRLAGGVVENITGAVVGAAADVLDEFALELLSELGARLGVGLAGLAKAFDPEVIVVGGGVSEEGELLLSAARDQLGSRFKDQVAPPILVSAALGNDAGVVGAAHLALGEVEAP
ncbi:MAG: ROK family protein, partial [Actinomycetota bacterium]